MEITTQEGGLDNHETLMLRVHQKNEAWFVDVDIIVAHDAFFGMASSKATQTALQRATADGAVTRIAKPCIERATQLLVRRNRPCCGVEVVLGHGLTLPNGGVSIVSAVSTG